MNRIALAIVLCLTLSPVLAEAADASLYVSPEVGLYTIGEIFDIKVMADTGGENINAAEAELTFSPDGLEVQRISVDDSILDAWPTPPAFSNQNGTIRFSGWTKNTYAGPAGLLITITFKALRTTTSNAHLAAGAILAADGRGSNIITSMKSGLYTIEPKQVDAVGVSEQAVESGDETPELTKIDVDAPPPAPVFLTHTATIETGERIIVSGTAPPDAKVLLFLSKGNGPEKYSAVTSDTDGSFTFVSDQGAEEGVYRLRASVQDAHGRISRSDRVTITARNKGFAAAASVGVDVVSTVAPLLILLVLGGLGAGYLLHVRAVEKMKHESAHQRGGARESP